MVPFQERFVTVFSDHDDTHFMLISRRLRSFELENFGFAGLVEEDFIEMDVFIRSFDTS